MLEMDTIASNKPHSLISNIRLILIVEKFLKKPFLSSRARKEMQFFTKNLMVRIIQTKNGNSKSIAMKVIEMSVLHGEY
ncbi:Oidioi.mRNA.OKI2018_I69.PAR.g8752.t1.cds [Oikopleura dioica]|uniref:Oidioi.mRNA.OKI2018_I69.PAR.g8752.t1.cds n=1 Tax=Oikopleura dioica TaxID=34765 RepID=A0ABN7RHE6_OIKDI|nr:Oidioi.mRNA.OKI2018_I69.PAR.g8752.t1.cds [Oikopleura dioica]